MPYLGPSYYSHFTEEATGTERVSDLLKVTQLASGGAGTLGARAPPPKLGVWRFGVIRRAL